MWLRAPQPIRILYIAYRFCTAAARRSWRYEPNKIIAIVIVRDLYSNLCHLVEELTSQGINTNNIWLIDAGTTNQQCLGVLDNLRIQGCKTIKPSGKALTSGPYVAWIDGKVKKELRKIDYPFILTDPDLRFKDSCPRDWLKKAFDTLMKHRYVAKVGLPLCTSDIDPEISDLIISNQTALYRHWFFRRASDVLLEKDTEGHICAIDTTMALYRPKSAFSTFAIRMNERYKVEHLPWKIKFRRSKEFQYYCNHKQSDIGEWS